MLRSEINHDKHENFFNKLEATVCALAITLFPKLGTGCELRFSSSFGWFVALFACYSEWTDIMDCFWLSRLSLKKLFAERTKVFFQTF